jgi:anti-sigma regulatory factor (Ser/Thr protein kinase)
VHNHDEVPVLLCCDPASETGRAVRAALRTGIPVYDHEAQALEALARGRSSSKRAHAHLRPDSTAPVVARRLVAKLCKDWDLWEICPIAELIVSELVTNAVRHAGTDIEVTTAVGDHYLHIHARDRAKRLPALSGADSLQTHHSRGLKLVDRLANGWGTTIAPYGKTVWATLRLKPLSGVRP